MFKVPKISCLTVTRGRYEWLKKSIRCFLNQTYANRELIILSQGDKATNSKIKEHIQSLHRSDIIFESCQPELSLGAMRNLVTEISTGSVLCQWDDDDFSHPKRIANQYRLLLKDKGIASVYRQHLKYYHQSGDLYWIDWSIEPEEWQQYLPGTIMFYKDVFHELKNMPYPERGKQCGKEEDLCVLQKILEMGKVNPVDDGYQYVYNYHGANIYHLEHHNYVLKKRVFDKELLLKHKHEIIDTLTSVGVEMPVKVRSLTEVAFEYDYNKCNEGT